MVDVEMATGVKQKATLHSSLLSQRYVRTLLSAVVIISFRKSYMCGIFFSWRRRQVGPDDPTDTEPLRRRVRSHYRGFLPKAGMYGFTVLVTWWKCMKIKTDYGSFRLSSTGRRACSTFSTRRDRRSTLRCATSTCGPERGSCSCSPSTMPSPSRTSQRTENRSRGSKMPKR